MINSTFKDKPRRPMNRVGSKRTLKCKVCEKLFETWPYRIRDGVRACSTQCAGVLRRNRSTHTCAFCGGGFTRSISQVFYRGAKYCNRECASKGMVSECAKKPLRDKYGRSGRKADRDWQQAVRDKDAYTCQRCGKVEAYIHAHHVAPRSRRPDLRLDVSNGKCLCNSCHSWVHEHPKEAVSLGLLSGDSYELARKKLRGSEHGMAKLNAEQVQAIRARRQAGEKVQEIAKEFDMHRCTISKIVNNRAY